MKVRLGFVRGCALKRRVLWLVNVWSLVCSGLIFLMLFGVIQKILSLVLVGNDLQYGKNSVCISKMVISNRNKLQIIRITSVRLEKTNYLQSALCETGNLTSSRPSLNLTKLVLKI